MLPIRRVDRATWEGSNWGRIALMHDWTEMTLPPISLREVAGELLLSRESSLEYAKVSGYAINGDWVSFVAKLNTPEEKLYVVGEFNAWVKGMGQKAWELQPQNIAGERWGVLTVRGDLLGESRLFKFVNAQAQWREPGVDAPNVAFEGGARNHYIDPMRSGAHCFRFEVEKPLDWKSLGHLHWQQEGYEEAIPLWPGEGFYAQKSDKPMGAIIEAGKTRFRVFAPRASKVWVSYFTDSTDQTRLSLTPDADGSWSVAVAKNLEGYSYYYNIEGPNWEHTLFDVQRAVMDPWALAVKGGYGVIVDKQKLLKSAPGPFTPPDTENLIIAEAHLRDLVAKAPLALRPEERRGYVGVKKLLEQHPNNPLVTLGVNAVELQPLAEFDGDGVDYHWGYMPTNFFAPASAYASAPDELSQLDELPQLVEAFHKRGVAVIVDVVFNHLGVPASPMLIDKAYYFRMNQEGALTNWSGCGNDYRIESAMAERLALEALEHWVLAYGVDGFRFDLGELLGVDFLAKVQKRLRAIKPGVILIAEPWSFRGHIAGAMKPYDYACWNDAYREFVPAYLAGKVGADALKYFIAGSVGGLTDRPVQTLNYVASHDDHVWIDKITQNVSKDGYFPTLHDRRLTHLMAGLMTMSLGVPMFALGQEVLHSKHGVNNTYLRGDLNAYDYARVREFPSTAAYFRDLIAFRKGPNGKAVRVRELEKDYLRFYQAPNSAATAVLYNAAKTESAKRVLFVINPTSQTATIWMGELVASNWTQVADHERVEPQGLTLGRYEWAEGRLELPPVSCGVFVEA